MCTILCIPNYRNITLKKYFSFTAGSVPFLLHKENTSVLLHKENISVLLYKENTSVLSHKENTSVLWQVQFPFLYYIQ